MRTPLLTLATLCLCTAGAHAQSLVEVAQESSPNAGDFDANILGTVGSYDTTLTASDYYGWNLNGLASFNGPAPEMASNTSKIFFLDGADGLSVVVLHDAVKETGGNDGEAGMRFEVTGDADGLARTVEDDPNGESPNDQYTGNAGDSVFTSQQSWFSCCADGSALTGLDGAWTLIVEFTDVDDNPATKDARNLFFWEARSGDGALVPLSLMSDRRVRFRLLEDVVEPCGTGDCFADNGTTGCDDEACCTTVCGIDAFCCDSTWDAACAELAFLNCDGAPTEACCFSDGSCQDLTAGDCSTAGGTSQGADSACDTVMCEAPAACPGEGDCFTDNGTVGCNDAECCETVCAADDYCCEVEWDDTCAIEAADLCTDEPATCPGEGDCYVLDNGTPGCNDAACCETVCDIDDFCCTVEWDGNCVEVALENCDDAPTGSCPGDGDCLEENGTPGCDDVDCCETVCSGDIFCCAVIWDDACVEDATLLCSTPTEACCLGDDSCIESEPALCAIAGGTAQGPDTNCDTTICIVMPEMRACCLNEETCLIAQIPACQAAGGTVLDPGAVCTEGACDIVEPDADEACCIPGAGCVEVDPGLCPVTGGTPQGPNTTCATTICDPQVCPGEGGCLGDNGTPGCENEACCNTVCTSDAFCCDTMWDVVCAEAAMTLCDALLPRACCLTDGSCQDLLLGDCILSDGVPQALGTDCASDDCEAPCPGDIDGDGNVDIDDVILIVIDFGMVGPDLRSDVNGDQMVNIDDIVDTIVMFGPCEDG